MSILMTIMRHISYIYSKHRIITTDKNIYKCRKYVGDGNEELAMIKAKYE